MRENCVGERESVCERNELYRSLLLSPYIKQRIFNSGKPLCTMDVSAVPLVSIRRWFVRKRFPTSNNFRRKLTTLVGKNHLNKGPLRRRWKALVSRSVYCELKLFLWRFKTAQPFMAFLKNNRFAECILMWVGGMGKRESERERERAFRYELGLLKAVPWWLRASDFSHRWQETEIDSKQSVFVTTKINLFSSFWVL